MTFDEIVAAVGPSGVTAIGIWVGTLYIRNLIYQMRDELFKQITERIDSFDERLSRVERRYWRND